MLLNAAPVCRTFKMAGKPPAAQSDLRNTATGAFLSMLCRICEEQERIRQAQRGGAQHVRRCTDDRYRGDTHRHIQRFYVDEEELTVCQSQSIILFMILIYLMY